MIKKLLEFIVIIVAIIIALGVIVGIVRSPNTTESPSNEVTKAEPVPPPRPQKSPSVKKYINKKTKPEPVVSSSPPPKPQKTVSNVKFGLTEGRRKSLFQEIVKAQDKADETAEEKFPSNPAQSLNVRDKFTITKTTPLMPELEPADPTAAIEQIKELPPKTVIRVIEIAKKNQTPWYYVDTMNRSKGKLGKGWINSVALLGQVRLEEIRKNMEKQGELSRSLYKQINADIAEKYNITVEQLNKIIVEGVEKNWLMRL